MILNETDSQIYYKNIINLECQKAENMSKLEGINQTNQSDIQIKF